ncbi:hypothetical protein TNCV_113011 [Trichonephila clavipes]|nr:hypothetical protein TNCV_113011 [Trichonephila clavipes]
MSADASFLLLTVFLFAETERRVRANDPDFNAQFKYASHGKIVEVEIGGGAIYRPFGEFRRANSYCHLYGAQGLGQRQAYF